MPAHIEPKVIPRRRGVVNTTPGLPASLDQDGPVPEAEDLITEEAMEKRREERRKRE